MVVMKCNNKVDEVSVVAVDEVGEVAVGTKMETVATISSNSNR